MFKNILTACVIITLFAGQSFAQADTKTKAAAPAQQPQKNTKEQKPENPLDKISREEILARLNVILERNPKILEEVPTIKKEMKGDVAVFSTGGKTLESLSKEELIKVLRVISPVLAKLQQEKLNKQIEQTRKAHEQNMQIQRAAQQQSQMKAPAAFTPPSVYAPPAKQQTPPAVYRPPSPPRR